MKRPPLSQISLAVAALIAAGLIWDRLQTKISRDCEDRFPRVARAALPGAAPKAQAGTSAGSAGISCYERARKKTLLGEGNAFLLCRGASSDAPVLCYERGQKETLLARRQLFDLCRCATSAGPIECYERGNRETFLEDRKIIELCSPVVTENLWPNCAPITGTPGPYR